MGKSLVLVFHKEENGPLFEKIILALKSKYSLVSAVELENLIKLEKIPDNICHISFDDGEKSFYNVVFPLLKKHLVPVSLFVSPEIISTGTNYWFQEIAGYDEKILKTMIARQLGISASSLHKYKAQSILKSLNVATIKKTVELYQLHTNCERKMPQNMNLSQLREVDVSGFVATGAHTLSHPVLKNEDDGSCFYEIKESIRGLEVLLGHTVSYFAYPNGRLGIDFGDREMNCLRENNISMGFSTALDHVYTRTNPLSIPRMGFARMGLSPNNPLVNFRLNAGKRWIDIKSVGKLPENEIRERIKNLLYP
jgi:peptidoglycan/xylan/chitin deacetylase (PgdA/CDA1 family)